MSKLVRESLNEARGVNRATAKLWDVFVSDDYGRKVRTVAIVWANDGDQARQIAGEQLKNPDIYNTGFFGVYETSEEDLKEKREELQEEMDLLNPIN
jgi:hypothetical protein